MKKLTTAEKIRRELIANPSASIAEIAKKLNVRYQAVWGIKKAMAQKAIADMKKDGLRRNAQGKILMQRANAPLLAPKLEAPTPEAPKEPELQGTDKLLSERGDRYGKFTGHAKVTQILKNVLSSHAKSVGNEFSFDQAEALDMICHKLGRIVNGGTVEHELATSLGVSRMPIRVALRQLESEGLVRHHFEVAIDHAEIDGLAARGLVGCGLLDRRHSGVRAGEAHGLATLGDDFFDGRGQRATFDVTEHQVGSQLGELIGGGESNATRSTSNNCRASVEFHGLPPSGRRPTLGG